MDKMSALRTEVQNLKTLLAFGLATPGLARVHLSRAGRPHALRRTPNSGPVAARSYSPATSDVAYQRFQEIVPSSRDCIVGGI